ncbi:uncharacterized protein [Haliotis asinina]|uniref:uncharacterized protein n=1 Tax=Haliotis asinina TaxID=109174 RepID=UPI00353262DF
MLKYPMLVLLIAIEGKGDECPLGTYGESCNKKCSINCAPSSSDKAIYCDKLTGRCSEGCNRGWHGDQCNFRCSRNCFNDVCNVQIGSCIQCKANYSGEYCETYEEISPSTCAQQTAQDVTSTPLAAILVPVIIFFLLIIITLIVYIHRLRSRSRKDGMKQDRGTGSRPQVEHGRCRSGRPRKGKMNDMLCSKPIGTDSQL